MKKLTLSFGIALMLGSCAITSLPANIVVIDHTPYCSEQAFKSFPPAIKETDGVVYRMIDGNIISTVGRYDENAERRANALSKCMNLM